MSGDERCTRDWGLQGIRPLGTPWHLDGKMILKRILKRKKDGLA